MEKKILTFLHPNISQYLDQCCSYFIGFSQTADAWCGLLMLGCKFLASVWSMAIQPLYINIYLGCEWEIERMCRGSLFDTIFPQCDHKR